MSGSTPTLTETVPDFRTVYLGKTTRFSYPKDPQDAAWYAVVYGEQVKTFVSAVVTPSDGATLTVAASQVLPDASGVALFLTAGTNGANYSLRLAVTTPGGDTIYRTVTLDVADR